MVKQQNRRTVHIQMKYSPQSIGNCIVSWYALHTEFSFAVRGGVLHSDARNFEENWNMEHGVGLTLFMEWITPLLAPTSVSTTSAWTPPPSTWSSRSWFMCQQCGHCGWHDGQHSQCGPQSQRGLHGQHGQHGQEVKMVKIVIRLYFWLTVYKTLRSTFIEW